ncbi:AIPR family protein [Nonomuraea bangladeshensis]|uniref:AIPR family protein n=1 Tax=Nonomuraea bangladeshensis TaxID=404385 RepID=A0ABV3GZA5_9ACTN
MVKPSGMPLQVRHVADALHKEFDGLIHMGDATKMSPEEFERKFLSRALAAFVARRLADLTPEQAGDAVIDGANDVGIDAIAFADNGLHLLLIQSKWKDRGTAGFGIDDARAFWDGLTSIDQQNFERFNERFEAHAEQVKAVLTDPRGRITLVVVLMGGGTLSSAVLERFDALKSEFNTGFDKKLDHDVWSLQRIWEAVRGGLAEPPIQLSAHMDEWIRIGEPYDAYQGRASAVEIAHWFDTHGDRLFSKNIRQSLGLTAVNHELVSTLVNSPHDFWYFNNGITVLCDRVERKAWSLGHKGPAEVLMEGASVVNGAQTVAAIAEAARRAPDGVAEAYVGLKVISTGNCPEGFGNSVTRATNVQNRVEQRDLVVALDSAQIAIREDFALSLDKTYTFRRGEPDPLPEAGCSVVQAAIALACAHRKVDLAVRAKRSTDLLWEAETYALLFKPAPTAFQIWHSYLIMRAVGAALQDAKTKWTGRARAVAEQADFLITHIVFRRIDPEGIDTPDYDLASVLARIPELVDSVLTWLIFCIDDEFGATSFISSTITNPVRCALLVDLVVARLADTTLSPDLPCDYKPAPRPKRQRRPNAVPTLVDAGRIRDGTILSFEYATKPEREALQSWLAEDSRRGQAAWVNDRSKPLVWAIDGRRYSPTGLVTEIWNRAGWSPDVRPVAVQGPSRWSIKGEGTLWELALDVLAKQEEEGDEGRA